MTVPVMYGEITARLFNRVVRQVMTNGHLLKVTTADNNEVTIAWVDGEGRPLKGRPVVIQSGARIKCEGINDVLYLPQIRTKGEA